MRKWRRDMYIDDFELVVYDKLPSEAIMLRKLVFVDEQGFQNEFDEIDENDKTKHIVVYKDSEPIGTCRFYMKDGEYNIGRLVEDTSEWIQIHLDVCSMQWKISKSPCSILQLWRLFEDFEDINARELHLMEYITENADEITKESPYYSYLKKAKKDYENSKKIIYL